MINDPMSAIRFQITPKGALLHYSCMFRNPDPLGMDINNVLCSRLGTMLYLDIKKGEETMKTS